MSKIILGDNSEHTESTNHEPNDKRAYLNKLKEKIHQRTTQQADNLKNELSESNVNKELVSDIKEIKAKLNLFQGRTEAEQGNAKFPDWDIVPPNQFINPRIKPQ